jgi:DNA-binding beta-propeller fold protein YncE
LLGTIVVGTSPTEIAFDGANIWVVNSGTNNVTKLRSSDGALLGAFIAGTAPVGIAFDGVNMWVSNNNTVTKMPVFP